MRHFSLWAGAMALAATIDHDTGGTLNNLVLKYPGWRAREGFGRPRPGVPGGPDDPEK